jgi:hypothetical protein
MMRFVIWPRALFARYVVERKDVDIGKTHQVHPENLDAMIEMCTHVFWVVICIGPLNLWVVWVCGHAQEVQTM